MARGEIYLELSVDFPDNPKVIAAGEKAELLYVRAALLAKRTLSDGFVADVQLPRFGLTGAQARARRLVEVGLWDRVEGGYQIRAFLDRNKSKEQVLADRAKDAARKRSDRPPVPPESGPMSSRNPDGVQTPETESEAETGTTPQPPAERGATSHPPAEGEPHPNCRQCGTNRRGRPDPAPPTPDGPRPWLQPVEDPDELAARLQVVPPPPLPADHPLAARARAAGGAA